jgi:RNA polymerase sigma factor, sigma-70 family
MERQGLAVTARKHESFIFDNDAISRQHWEQRLNHKILSMEETNSLIRKYQETGDREAFERIILHNQRLVYSVAKMYMKSAKEYTGELINREDLMQSGMIGLVLAIDKFDLERKMSFSTYAVYWIQHEVRRYLSASARIIHIPDYLQTSLRNMKKAKSAMAAMLGREPSTYELAQELAGLSQETVERLLACDPKPKSLDAIIEEMSETYLIDENAIDPETAAVNADTRARMEKCIYAALTEREERIIRGYYGFGFGGRQSFGQLGEQENISRQRAEQIHQIALRKLRERGAIQELHV